MDILTHGLSGVLLGRAFSNKIKHNKANSFIIGGILASIFPDFDFLFRLISAESYLMNHRGITHSIFLLPMWAYLVSLFLAWMFHGRILFHEGWINDDATKKELQKEFFILSLVSIAVHIFFDIITSFGTMVFSPFDNTRVELGSVYIIDFWFTGIILVGILLSWKLSVKKHIPAIVSLFFLTAYIGLTQYLKYEAEDFAINKLATTEANVNTMEAHSFPAMFSPFKWNVAVYDINNQSYYYANFDLLYEKYGYFNNQLVSQAEAKEKNQDFWKMIPQWGNNEIYTDVVKVAWQDPSFKNYRWFLQIPAFHSIIKNDNKLCVYFKDLRFTNSLRDDPFVYGICATKDGKKYISHWIGGVDNPI